MNPLGIIILRASTQIYQCFDSVTLWVNLSKWYVVSPSCSTWQLHFWGFIFQLFKIYIYFIVLFFYTGFSKLYFLALSNWCLTVDCHWTVTIWTIEAREPYLTQLCPISYRVESYKYKTNSEKKKQKKKHML